MFMRVACESHIQGKMRALGFLLLPLLFGSFAMNARLQVNEFYIKKGGIKIGSLTASLHSENDLKFYTISSQSSAWVGTRIWVYHKMKSVYDKNKLVKAEIEMRSSKGTYNSWVIWKKDHYEYDVNGINYKRTGKITVPITFSVAKLYFQEPLSEKEIFTENHAEIVKLLRPVEHTFQVGSASRPNTFYYRNGKLSKVDMTSSSVSYSIELKDN